MVKHKCIIDEEEIGFDLINEVKEYFCPICQKVIMRVNFKDLKGERI